MVIEQQVKDMTPQQRCDRMASDLTSMGLPAISKISFTGTPYVLASNFTVCWFGNSQCYRTFLADKRKIDVKGSPYHCAAQIKELV